MKINLHYDFLPKTPSTRNAMVMDHFGIDFEQGQHVIADDLELPIQPGQVVLFTGESGSGKSSLMNAVASKLAQSDSELSHLEQLSIPDGTLIDAIPLEFKPALKLLSACGLGEAQLMLRTPAELSDGQRYRFQLAFALAQQSNWVVADEFSATLDRRLAKMIAHNIRRNADGTETGFLLATTHDDIVESLDPDVHIRCSLDGQIEIESRSERKKKRTIFTTVSGSHPRPNPTGRISLGGITAPTKSDSSNS